MASEDLTPRILEAAWRLVYANPGTVTEEVLRALLRAAKEREELDSILHAIQEGTVPEHPEWQSFWAVKEFAWISGVKNERDALLREREELQQAITWALGAGDDFPARQDGQGAYWWRTELAKRAGATWDGERYVFGDPR